MSYERKTLRDEIAKRIALSLYPVPYGALTYDKTWENPYPKKIFFSEAVERIAAALGEGADDEEPVTVDWLVSIGGQPRAHRWGREDDIAFKYGPVMFLSLTIDDGGWVAAATMDIEITGDSDEKYRNVWLVNPETRGQVRLLLKALGIELSLSLREKGETGNG